MLINIEEIAPGIDTSEYFALVMQGDSMEPRVIDGDILIVHRQADVASGDVAAVRIGGDDMMIRRVTKKASGLLLSPTNAAHEFLLYTPEEVRNLPVVIIGRVVEVRSILE